MTVQEASYATSTQLVAPLLAVALNQAACQLSVRGAGGALGVAPYFHLFGCLSDEREGSLRAGRAGGEVVQGPLVTGDRRRGRDYLRGL